jgi:hypothetical protein
MSLVEIGPRFVFTSPSEGQLNRICNPGEGSLALAPGRADTALLFLKDFVFATPHLVRLSGRKGEGRMYKEKERKLSKQE